MYSMCICDTLLYFMWRVQREARDTPGQRGKPSDVNMPVSTGTHTYTV